jgi:integrase
MVGRDAANAYNDACRAIGISDEERKARKLGFHAWRHFYVSMMRASTESRTVQAVVRHSNESTTKRYSHLTDEQRREIAGLAGGLLAEE